jgi:hypothetical protein
VVGSEADHASRLPPSKLCGAVPRIVAFENVVKLEHIDEVVTAIGGLTNQQAEIDQSEHNVADVGGATDSPMIQDVSGEHTVTIERQITTRTRELASCNVPTLGEPGLAELQRGKNKQVRGLLETSLAQPDLVHDSIPKRQFRQLLSPS